MKCKTETSAISDLTYKKIIADRSIDPEKTGKFIAELRTSRNLTQDQLGSMIYISRKSVSKWETGRACPSIDMLKKLSEVLDVSLEELIAGEYMKHESSDINFVFKVLKNKFFKTFSKVVGVILFLIISACIFKYFTADKIFIINYEDETFTISNGVIVLSGRNSYIFAGNLYSNVDNLDEATSLNIVIFYMEGDREVELISFNKEMSVPLDKETRKAFRDAYKDGKFDKLTIKISYDTPDQGRKTHFLKPSVKEALGVDTSNFENGIDTHTTKESPNVEINLNFIFDLEAEEIKECYSGKKIKVDDQEYKISYDSRAVALNISSQNEFITFSLDSDSLIFNTKDIQFVDLKDDTSIGFLTTHNYNILQKLSKELKEIKCSH